MSHGRISSDQSAALGYRLLRIAAERFDTTPEQLDEHQRREIQRIAHQEQQLEQLVLTSPEATNVSVPDSQVQRALDQIRSRYEAEQDFGQSLSDLSMTEPMLYRELARSLRVEAVLELVASAVPAVSEVEAQIYYYLHPEKFGMPERRAVRHILITVNDDLPGNDSETAYQRSKAIAKRLQKDPRRFAEQSLKHSECPSSLNDGWLGEVVRGVLYPELDEVLFRMRRGQVSDPVETESGWHVLLCEQIHPAGQIPIAKALPKLMDKLQQRQVRNAQRKWLDQRQQAESPMRQERAE